MVDPLGGAWTIVGPLMMFGGACQVPWQAFKSQFVPHAGSQKSPGHQLIPGPGCAWASVAAAKPAQPKPAAITAVAAIQLASLFMALSIPAQPMRSPSRPLRSDEQLHATPLSFIPSCCSTSFTSGRSGTRRCFGLPTRQCGSWSRTPGTARRHAGTHKCAAGPGRKTARHGHVRAVSR